MSCTIIGINFHIMSIMSKTGKWTFGWFFPFLSLTQRLCKVNNLFRWFKDHHWLNDYDRKKHTHTHTHVYTQQIYIQTPACMHTHTHMHTHAHTFKRHNLIFRPQQPCPSLKQRTISTHRPIQYMPLLLLLHCLCSCKCRCHTSWLCKLDLLEAQRYATDRLHKLLQTCHCTGVLSKIKHFDETFKWNVWRSTMEVFSVMEYSCWNGQKKT